MKSMELLELPKLRLEDSDLQLEFDFEYSINPAEDAPSVLAQVNEAEEGLRAVHARLQENDGKIEVLNKEIDRLTSHADGIDVMVSVASGILAGLLDSFWVGEFNFQRGKAWSNQTVNDFVMKVAKSQGYTGERLDGAIEFLERKFPVPSDSIWKGKDLGISARSHHLDDLAHHPSPIGLFFSILAQFTRTAYFQNSNGTFLPIDIDEKSGELIGSDLPTKLFAGTVNWFMHIVSDMSGSNKTAGVGMGVPGPLVSLLKEISTIPGINNLGLAKKLKEVFGVEKFDLRAELAVGHELARQALPVILNEVVVRAFYFFRRLWMQWEEKRNWSRIDWKATMPCRNRTIVRMLTIAHGTFTAVDVADAAIRGAIKSGGDLGTFAKEFLLRVNYVGVGRFTVAVYSDVRMEVQRNVLQNDRIRINCEQLHLLNAKVYYLQAETWIAADSAHSTIIEALALMERTAVNFSESLQERRQSLIRFGECKDGVEKNNPGLIAEINDQLRF